MEVTNKYFFTALKKVLLWTKTKSLRKGEKTMKNRRLTIVAFLLCATIVVGFGYAALTDVLDITGSADVNQSAAENAFDADIIFTGADVITPAKEGPKPNTASVNADNNDKASFSAYNLQGKDDTAQFKFTIKNNGDVAATVTPSISSNTNEAYFAISSDWNGQPKDLEAGAELTYTVTVTLKSTPTDTISGSFIIELTATSVNP